MPKRKRRKKYTANPKATQMLQSALKSPTVLAENAKIDVLAELRKIGIVAGIILLILLVLFLVWR